MELTTVTTDSAVFHDGTDVIVRDGLQPDTEVEAFGAEFRTLPRRGELLCRFATVNDVHFGETVCGLIQGSDVGPVLSVGPDDDPYPEVMNRGAVSEIVAADPALVVAKGDLTSSGRTEEYERFLEVYGVFGDRLVHVRGNHDSYHHGEFAAFATQEVELPGVRIAVLDTARDGRANGDLSADQVVWLDEGAARSDEPVLVFGHHHVWDPDVDPRSDGFFGLVPEASEALAAVAGRRRSIRGYFAGHTHRNRRIRLAAAPGVEFVEVACVKDYPGTWALYEVYEGAILQIHRRISTPEALAWSEKTREMYDGAYAWYAFGDLDERCFAIPTA